MRNYNKTIDYKKFQKKLKIVQICPSPLTLWFKIKSNKILIMVTKNSYSALFSTSHLNYPSFKLTIFNYLLFYCRAVK